MFKVVESVVNYAQVSFINQCTFEVYQYTDDELS